MAKISQTSITLELETLSCDDMGDGIVILDITVEEAQELMEQLKNRFSENTVEPAWLHYPEGVRGFDAYKYGVDCDLNATQARMKEIKEGQPVLKSQWEALVDALKSIANSSCCGDCQEAKRVAEVALYKVGEAQSIPAGDATEPDWESYYSNLYMAVAQRFQGSYGLKMSAADWDSLRRNFPRPTKV